MADKNVDINFKTTADTKGAKKVEKEIKEVGKASKRQGRDSIDAARLTESALEGVEATARGLRDQLDKIDGLDPKIRKQFEGLADSMDRAAMNGRKLAASKGEVRKSSRNAGGAILEFSRAIEDAQYGIRGVLNNIPGLIAMLGGTAGFAGVISLVAVGLTQLTGLLDETAERSKEATKLAGMLAEGFEAVQEQARKGEVGYFADQIAEVSRQIGLQNSVLRSNRDLLIQKRKHEMEIATLQEDSDLAALALQAATDDSFTASDYQDAVARVEANRIEREKRKKILEAQDRIEEEYDKQAQIEEEKSRLSQEAFRTSVFLANQRKLEARLLQRKNNAEALLADADENRNSFFASGLTSAIYGDKYIKAAEQQEQAALRQFDPEVEGQQLEAIQQNIRQAQSLIEKTRSQRDELAIQLENVEVGILQAEESERLVRENANRVAEIKTTILETQAASKIARKAHDDLSAGIADLEKSAADTASMTEADRRMVEVANSQFRKVLNDDNLTARELQETSQVLGRLSMSLAGASKKNTEMIQELQFSVDQLSRVLAATKAENVRLSQQIKNLNRRQ